MFYGNSPVSNTFVVLTVKTNKNKYIKTKGYSYYINSFKISILLHPVYSYY